MEAETQASHEIKWLVQILLLNSTLFNTFNSWYIKIFVGLIGHN